jgi:hypothetical protein
MTELENYQRLRDGLRAIKIELEEMRAALSTDEFESECIQPVTEMESEDFFDQIIQGDQLPARNDLYRKVLSLITNLGYASTLVLQTRLEISYQQSLDVIADLERSGLIAPAHGFRPHKVLSTAYALRERMESGMPELQPMMS